MQKIGYARVSKDIQDISRQVSALQAAGCDRIVEEYKSGAKKRPKLEEMLKGLQPGDTVVVVKLDRFGRSIIDLLNKVKDLQDNGIGFVSLGDSFDINTANGRLLLHMLAAMAEFERELIRERVNDSIRNSRLLGIKLGRKKLPVDQGLIDQIKGLQEQGLTRLEIQEKLGISKNKYYRLLLVI